MPSHIGFLRAVNIGKRQYRTADLRAALEGAGYTDVETHIQTGNIKISAPLRSSAKVEAALEELFLADRGFDVVTMVFTPQQVTQMAADADELAAAHGFEYGQYVSVLKHEPAAATRKEIEALGEEGERLVVRGRAVHMLYDVPYGTSKTATRLEKVAGPATNRNAKVIRALAEKWG
ncbi:uncharacterized protein (DUF1697 family) [Marmoricola sp. URHA0025 HA25]